MRVVSWSDLLAGREAFREPVRLSIGVFDGLHEGHRRLLRSITEGPGPAMPLIITFVRSPAQVLAPGNFPGLILSRAQKLTRFASVGV
ncbi:MAG TPA: riboflavin biosynthesis protein RibF, partial [Spirochaetia bacterium]|nr:riboflavin biosynthesis protein RibF [Spirochaetia bacterium]